MNETVYIILPVYNAEDTVAEAIESVLAQTYSNLELFCINDGSSDGSDRVIQRYAQEDRRVHYFFHENCGLGESRNFAITRAISAGARFIAFNDADDVWHNNKLEFQMRAF